MPEDKDVRAAYEWFQEFINPSEWDTRRAAIEHYLSSILEPRRSREEAGTLEPISISDDKMGWYLYLADTYLNTPEKYELSQGSRVIPPLKTIGMNLGLLRGIPGIDERAETMVSSQRAQPDSGLFEILTALMYARDGWEIVEFIPESPPDKRPDIHVAGTQGEWFVECKRLSKSSGYSLREREKWLSMWRPLAGVLIANKLPVVLDITFHVELESLQDDFLKSELQDKLRLAVPPCQLISNDVWDVRIWSVDLHAIRQHLARNYVKTPSTQLNMLIAGKYDPQKGFTAAVEGKYVEMVQGGNNRYLDEIRFAAGAFWHCDAVRAIEQKARDIRGHLAQAVEQLPSHGPSVIHVGLETLDGGIVERERYNRIVNTVYRFDALGKDLRWIYCHLFQPESPPDELWAFDETVYSFSNHPFVSRSPLKSSMMVVPDEGDVKPGVHWLPKHQEP